MNDHYPVAPEGFTLQCSRTSNRDDIGPSPKAWYEQMLAKGQPVRLELIDGGGHGMMFANFSSSSRQLPRGRAFYASHGASPDGRSKLQKLVLEFLESKL
jgi:hypothetical protein